MSESLEPDPGEPIAGFEPGRLRDASVSELAIRFGFGAGVSIVAALVGLAFGSTLGGAFLAFPAILPATLTLLEQKHGTEDAVHDQRGALLGAIGLVAFALAGAILFDRVAASLVFLAATAAWVVISVGLYLAVARYRRSTRRSRNNGPAATEARA
jgi:hypothetical protein